MSWSEPAFFLSHITWSPNQKPEFIIRFSDSQGSSFTGNPSYIFQEAKLYKFWSKHVKKNFLYPCDELVKGNRI